MWAVAAVGGSALAVVALIRTQQYRLLYLPQITLGSDVLLDPSHFNFDHRWRVANMSVGDDNVFGYFLMHGRDDHGPGSWRDVPTVIYFHGNAGNIGHRIPLAMNIHSVAQCNVLLVAYRGYKGSTEKPPSEEGFRADAQAALDYVVSSGADPSKVFILGSSLGGALTFASALDSKHKLRGIAVENTFTSISDMSEVMADQIMLVGTSSLRRMHERSSSELYRLVISTTIFLLQYLGAMWWALRPGLLSLEWKSIERVTQLPARLPVLFLSGERDELVPPEHMQRLYNACSSEVKSLVTFPHGMHNDTNTDPRFYQELADWMGTCLRNHPPVQASRL